MIKLSYVPPPPVGATVYSILAAAVRLAPNVNLGCSLIGAKGRYARPLWPIGLENIANAMPPALEMDADDLLRNHTMVPAFLPCMTRARREALIASAMRIDAGEPGWIAGANMTKDRSPVCLRICPKCLELGRHWWMNVHQMPGVLVCTEHPDVVLCETSAHMRVGNRYVDARDAQIGPPCATLGLGDFQIAVKIASAMQSLLSGDLATPGPDQLRSWLVDRLCKAGFVHLRRGIDLRAASAAIFDWLGRRLSAAIGRFSSDSDTVRWLRGVYHRRAGATIQPLSATLPIIFLGLDIRAAFSEAADFGVVSTCRSRATLIKPGTPRKHLCFEKNEAVLRRLWVDPQVSVSEIGRRMTVNHVTVSKWAHALGLPFPRRGPGNSYVRCIPKKRLQRFDDRLARYRASWIEAVGSLPQNTSATIHPKTRRFYSWLMRCDRRWIKANFKKKHREAYVDWRRRDADYSSRVRSAAEGIAACSKPTRISVSRIMAHMGIIKLIARKKQMPNTHRQIERYVETHLEFAWRRLRMRFAQGTLRDNEVRWAISYYPALEPRLRLAGVVSGHP